MAPVKGVILDLDGTLIDSNDAHARAWVAAMKECGLEPDFERIRRLIGMGGPFLLARVGIDAESEEGKKIRARRGEIFRESCLPLLKPFDKARELLLRMRAGGLRLVVASASERAELDEMLKKAQIDDLVEATSASDVDDPKPAPDVVHAALEMLGLSPDEVLLLGDTPYDIEAARRAGVEVVALRGGGWEDEGLRGARAVYWDVADLFARYGESPFALER